jgi:hypothetical protein
MISIYRDARLDSDTRVADYTGCGVIIPSLGRHHARLGQRLMRIANPPGVSDQRPSAKLSLPARLSENPETPQLLHGRGSGRLQGWAHRTYGRLVFD